MIKNPALIIILLLGILSASFWLDRKFKWAAKLGASTLVIIFGALLSNLGLVTAESDVYNVISGPVTSLAIVWLLFSIDFSQIKLVGPRMLSAFGLAALGTLVGIITTTLLLHHLFKAEFIWKICGCETGSYIGGGVNLGALARELKLEKSVFAAIAAADNIVTTIWMGATLLLPVILAFAYPKRKKLQSSEHLNILDEKRTIKTFDFCALIIIGAAIIILSKSISHFVPYVPEIIFLSTLALLTAQIKWIKGLSGAFLMGIICLNLFLATMGIGAKISEILKIGPKVFYFTSCVVFIHGLIIYSIGKKNLFTWKRKTPVSGSK